MAVSIMEAQSREMKSNYFNPLNKSLQVFFKNALTVSVKNPAQTETDLRRGSGVYHLLIGTIEKL